MHNPDPQLVISRGEAADQLMASDAFLGAVDDMSHHHMTAVACSPPGPEGLAAREYHHMMHYALSEIVSAVRARAQAGIEMKHLIALTTDAEDDE